VKVVVFMEKTRPRSGIPVSEKSASATPKRRHPIRSQRLREDCKVNSKQKSLKLRLIMAESKPKILLFGAGSVGTVRDLVPP
jgi:hypothetical protein